MVFGRFVKKINPCVKNLSTSPCLKKRNRTKQRAFREKLIQIYEKCPLDNVNPKLCEAAHILPYSNCKKKKDKYNPNNGILLSCNMHKAFDSNFFTFDEKTCKLVILEENIKKIDDDCNLENFNLKDLENKYIPQLDNEESKNFLKKRNEIYDLL